MTKLFIFAILILVLLTLSEAKKVTFIYFSFIVSLIILYFQKSKHQKEKQDEKQENVIADSEKTRQGKLFEITSSFLFKYFDKDPCLKMKCGAGKECLINENGEAKCSCVK